MRSRTALLALGMVGLSVAAAYISVQFYERDYRYQGAIIDPPALAYDIRLVDSVSGRLFRLSDQKGKVVLLFFGYTSCPDVCPATLAEFREIRSKLGDKVDKVVFVYISVDPERDTSEKVSDYVGTFDPAFIGLTGEETELAPLWKAYGVFHQKRDAGSAAGYLIDHTASTYVIDSSGNWRMTFPFGMDADAMLQDITHLLVENN